ncbi:MAG: hypothetical protein L0Z47_02540 [Actinobacteria bacterium]|nr:hypothetical protein [Actinomycetota bacterium]
MASETWSYDYDANVWRQMEPALSPPPRAWAAMSYDDAADRVILFGGSDLSDTWAYDYDTDTWKELSPSVSPPGRQYVQMAFDSVTATSVLFGGVSGPTEETLDDTWSFDYAENTWTRLTPAVPPSARSWDALVADSEAGVIVMFGGGATRDSYTAETSSRPETGICSAEKKSRA